jgi:hypothetical protein
VPLPGVPAEPPAPHPFFEQLLAAVTEAGLQASEPQAAAGHDRSFYFSVPSYEFPPCSKSKSNLLRPTLGLSDLSRHHLRFDHCLRR